MDRYRFGCDVFVFLFKINDQRKAEIKESIRSWIIKTTEKFIENEKALDSDITLAGLHSHAAAVIAAEIETELDERLAGCRRPAIVHGLALYGLNVVTTELIEEFTAGQGDSHA